MSLFHGISIDDMCHGANEWRNIQEVVRASFKVFYDTLCAQAERIRALESANDELVRQVSQLVSAVEQRARSDDVRAALATKADRISLEEISKDVAHHAVQIEQRARADDVRAALTTKADRAVVEEMAKELSQHLVLIESKARAEDVRAALATKMNRTFGEEISQELAHYAALIETKARAEDVRNALATKADRAAFEELAKQVSQQAAVLDSKAYADDVRVALATKADRTALDELSKQVAQQGAVLETKAFSDDVRTALTTKADRAVVDEMNKQLAHQAAVLETKAFSDDVRTALATKADRTALDEISKQLVQQAVAIETKARTDDELAKEIALRATIKDVCTLLDMKANITDVNNALMEVNRELDQRALVSDLNKIAADQALVHESLVAEQCVARWIWKTGKTKATGLVPWNVQSVNTSPDNFVWEKDRSHVVVVAPGLYEISFGFFARKKPTVQLLVNGEPVLSAINTASYVVHHSSGRLAAVGSHSAGPVTGLTLIDFLALPPRAKISLQYNGEEGAEGFLSLRKL